MKQDKQTVSKSGFKSRVLKFFRQVEKTRKHIRSSPIVAKRFSSLCPFPKILKRFSGNCEGPLSNTRIQRNP